MYLKGTMRERETKRSEMGSTQFTSQIYAMARIQPGQSQE